MSGRKHRPWVSGVAVALFLAAWELAARARIIDPVLISAPSRIARSAAHLAATGALTGDIRFTMESFGISLAIALFGGVLLGIAMGASGLAHDVFNPFVAGASSLPKIVLMPIVVLWLGVGLAANAFLGALMGSFPILTSVRAGVRSLDRDLVLLGRAYGANRWMLLRAIVLPAVAPFVLSGLRVAVSYAMVGVLLGEFFASSHGLGYRMVVFTANFRVDEFYVCVLVVLAITAGCTALVHALERRFEGWRPDALARTPGM